MRKRFTATIKTPGKKLASIVTCAALVLALGTTSVFADDGSKKDIVGNENGNIVISDISLSQVHPNPYKVFVNGEEVAVEGYNINGSSYFNLQDIHAVTDFNVEFEKEKMVAVTYAINADEDAPQSAVKKGMYYSSYDNNDEEASENFISSTVMVKTENDLYYYSTDGGETWNEFVPEELNADSADYDIVVEDMQIYPDTRNVFVNGNEVVIEGYNINGTTNLKLRDVAEATGFDVEFENDTIIITTSANYGENTTEVKTGTFYYSPEGEKAEGEEVISTTVMVKNENGTYYSSTDNGETWNEFIPEDFGADNGLIIQR